MRNEKRLIPNDFLVLKITLLNFVITGKTIESLAQQTVAQYLGRGEIEQYYPSSKVGYPSTDFGDSFCRNWEVLTEATSPERRTSGG